MKKIFFLLLAICPSIVFAQAQVFPTRLTLTEETPSSYINVKNPSDKSQTYKIELTTYTMEKDGSMKKSASSSSSLNEIIKFSPKKVTVSANDKQVVRVMATGLENLPEGEHYIHLHFLPVDEKEPAITKETKDSTGFALKARIAVAVPIVVRKGSGSFTGEIKNLKAQRTKEQGLLVDMDILNKNKFYIYGDMDIFGIHGKEEILLEKINGISSYLPQRNLSKKFSAKAFQEKTNGKGIEKVKITFRSNADSVAPFEISQEVAITESKKAK